MSHSPSYRLILAAALAVVTVLAVATSGTAAIFTNITPAAMELSNFTTESVAWGDYDNDGDQDIYLTNIGENKLFRNDGGDIFTDVSAVTGVGDAGWGVGCAFADLDNDGDLDLFVVNFPSFESDLLYRNDGPVGPGGEYQFTDVASAGGVTLVESSRGMAFLDFNADGLLDIYVNAIGPDILYVNLGGLRFKNAAADYGIDANSGQGVGVVASDVDNNGWIDLFTGNRSGDPNRLFMNNGGILADATAGSGIEATGLGMGVLAFDYDNDLDMDLYWTAWPNPPFDDNALYENLSGTTFAEMSLASGTRDTAGWGISCNAGDIDNDGWEDFYVTNGLSETSSPNVLFRNQGDGTFSDATASVGGGAFDGRGVAFADYDNDGDLDLLVTSDIGELNQLWRNDTATSNHWLTLDLAGSQSNRSAVGARIEVTTDLRTVVKEVSGGAGRGSFNSLPVEFGLGAATEITNVHIRWPNGAVQNLSGVAMDQRLTVTEPAGTVSAAIHCSPDNGTVPFATVISVSLDNHYTGLTRRVAARLNLDLANGMTIPGWRAGFTNVAAGGTFGTSWTAAIPAIGPVIGANSITLVAQDVTPAPFNQPPYPPSGDSDSDSCTVTAAAP
jgi:hypothetical protein